MKLSHLVQSIFNSATVHSRQPTGILSRRLLTEQERLRITGGREGASIKQINEQSYVVGSDFAVDFTALMTYSKGAESSKNLNETHRQNSFVNNSYPSVYQRLRVINQDGERIYDLFMLEGIIQLTVEDETGLIYKEFTADRLNEVKIPSLGESSLDMTVMMTVMDKQGEGYLFATDGSITAIHCGYAQVSALLYKKLNPGHSFDENVDLDEDVDNSIPAVGHHNTNHRVFSFNTVKGAIKSEGFYFGLSAAEPVSDYIQALIDVKITGKFEFTLGTTRLIYDGDISACIIKGEQFTTAEILEMNLMQSGPLLYIFCKSGDYYTLGMSGSTTVFKADGSVNYY